jgi:hypothetical protein
VKQRVRAGDNVTGVDQDVETRLRAALRDALKSRDVVAAFAVRSALAAIGNAEAVPAGPDGASPAANRAARLRHEAGILRDVLAD